MLYRNYQLNKTHRALKFGHVIGYPATLRNCRAARMRKLHVFGNTIQDGTPAPDNPVKVQGVGDRTANLFDKDTIFNSNAVMSPDNALRYCRIKLAPNTTYTLSNNAPQTTLDSGVKTCISWLLSGYASKGASINVNGVYDGQSRYAVSDSNGYITIAFRIAHAKINITEDDIVNEKYWFMLNEGSTTLPYEPYGYKVPLALSNSNREPQTFPIYTDMPLYKIGNYADRIILALGAKTAMLERNIFITNSQDIQLNGKSRVAETNSFYYSVKKELANPEWTVNQIFNGANTSDELTDVICDMLPTLPIKMLYGHTDVTGICITKTSDNTACEIRLNLPTDIATTVDEANEYFHGLSCNIYRVLQTPVVIDISNKIDWNSIPKFWNGTVIISTNTTISPSNLEVKYIRR